jgi:hypothetical protein
MRWVGHVEHVTEISAYSTSVGKPQAKMPLGRPRLDGEKKKIL